MIIKYPEIVEIAQTAALPRFSNISPNPATKAILRGLVTYKARDL